MKEQQKAAGLLVSIIEELAYNLPASNALQVIYIVEIDPILSQHIRGRVEMIESAQNDRVIQRMRTMVTPAPGTGRRPRP